MIYFILQMMNLRGLELGKVGKSTISLYFADTVSIWRT